MKYTLFIFRRDLRIQDNIGLNYAIKNFNNIIPVFIFTPEQISKKNQYRSNIAVNFMLQCLEGLNKILKKLNSELYFFYGTNLEVLKNIIKVIKVENIVFNLDYTPYALQRDLEILKLCRTNEINCIIQEDYLLNPIGTYLNKKNNNTGIPYKKFTSFKNNAIRIHVKHPVIYKANDYKKLIKNKSFNTTINKCKYKIDFKQIKYKLDFNIMEFKLNNNNKLNNYKLNNYKSISNRDKALNIITNINLFKKYNNSDFKLTDNTTNLSHFIKFGCVSIREVFNIIEKKLGINHFLITQLFWREFYYYIGFYSPKVLNKSINHNKNYDIKKSNYNYFACLVNKLNKLNKLNNNKLNYNSKINLNWRDKNIKWNNNKLSFISWCNAKTGYPIIDAGMRELNRTGNISNRIRLIVANFLVRILRIHWILGEQYFACKLIDYDPIVNNGNWQWVASTGANYRRPTQNIYNPWDQGKRYDPKAEYIKKWIPELKNLKPYEIHSWDKYYSKYKNINYLKPIVDYKKERALSLKMFK